VRNRQNSGKFKSLT